MVANSGGAANANKGSKAAEQQHQQLREDERKRMQDDAVAQWLASAPSSALDDAFNLTPVQLSLGMSKPAVFLANAAMDFTNVFGPSQRRQLTAERMEEVQQRFVQLQQAYHRHLASESPAAVLHLSPRMVVESAEDISAMNKLWADCLEDGARASQKSLEADLVLEKEANERREERRKRKLKKKRERRKCRRDGAKMDGSTEVDEKERKEDEALEDKENDAKERNGSSGSVKEIESATSQTVAEKNNDTDVTLQKSTAATSTREKSFTVVTDSSSPESQEETGRGCELVETLASPIKARSLHALAATDDTRDGDVESNIEPALRPPPGISSKTSDRTSSAGSFGSYLEAARAAQLRAEVDSLRTRLKAERAQHLEAVQQVQLKAFIAESRASAEAERAEKLERVLAEVMESGGDIEAVKGRLAKGDLRKAAAAVKGND